MTSFLFSRFGMFFCVSVCFSLAVAPLFAEPEVTEKGELALTSVRGRVQMPKDISKGIDTDGLSLAGVEMVLEGNYKHPRMPYPENWKSITREERADWLQAFKNSDEYAIYLQKEEEARAKRATFRTKLAKDGSFVFTDIPVQWYQLRAVIMHSQAGGELSYERARAHKMRQFIIRNADEPYDVGTMTLELKNVLMKGDLAPDWKAMTYEGREFRLSSFRGRFVLIDFWATWCGPCLAEIPNLEAVHEELGGDHLTVIGLSVDKKMDAATAFLKKNPSAYRHGFMGQGERYQKVREAYGISSIPSIWLIGPDGSILARDLRGPDLKEAVRKVMEVEVTLEE